LDRAVPDMGFLVVWASVFFAVGYSNFLRYNVR
jgi:hypothetical protein